MCKWIRVIFLMVPSLIRAYFPLRRYAKHPERYSIEERYFFLQRLIQKVLKAFRVDLKVYEAERLENLWKEDVPFLWICNHLSDLDPLILIAISKKPISVVAKKETRRYPFIGLAVQALDGYFLDREDLRSSLRVIRSLEKRLETGKVPYVIFPEGTRQKNAEEAPLDFHPGSFKAATLSKRPLLVSSIFGTFRVFPKDTSWKHYPVQVKIIDVIKDDVYGGMETPELAKIVKEKVETGVNFLKEKDVNYLQNKKHLRR